MCFDVNGQIDHAPRSEVELVPWRIRLIIEWPGICIAYCGHGKVAILQTGSNSQIGVISIGKSKTERVKMRCFDGVRKLY